MKYRQKGYNCLYPPKIETWRLGEKVPEWLSDRAAIEFIDGEGNITLKTRSLSGGGFEIIQAGGRETLCKVSKKEDYIYKPIDSKEKLPEEFEPWDKRNLGIRGMKKETLENIYETFI